MKKNSKEIQFHRIKPADLDLYNFDIVRQLKDQDISLSEVYDEN